MTSTPQEPDDDALIALDRLLRMTVPVPAGCVGAEGEPMSPGFVFSIQLVTDEGVHFIIRASGHSSDTLNLVATPRRLALLAPFEAGETREERIARTVAAGLELTVANENGLVSDFAVIADRLRDLAFTLAVGGQEEAAPLNLIARIEWGVEHIQQTEIERLIRLFEGLIEEMSKIPGTTWGAIKTAVRERAIVALEALPHTELVAENARLRATLQQIHDLADGLLNDIEAEEALA